MRTYYSDAAEYASRLMGREIRFQAGVHMLGPEDDHIRKIFMDKGAVGRVNRDGSVDVFLDTGRFSEHAAFNVILRQAVFNVALKEGLDGFFHSRDQFMAVALWEGLLPGHMTDTDLRAFARSCAHADNVDLRLARKILQTSFGTDDFPLGLEKQLAGGFNLHRKKEIADLNVSGNEDAIKEFAKETLSKYSYHKHLHLGFPAHAMADMGYPNQELYMDIYKFTKLSSNLGVSPIQLVEKGFIKEIRNPLCIISNPIRTGHLSLVLNTINKNGNFITAEILSPKDAEGFKGTKILGFNEISPNSLWKVISYRKRDNNKIIYPNTFYLKQTSDGNYDIVHILNSLSIQKKSSGNHRADFCEHDYVTALSFDAKILQFFENPKNNKDIGKKNEVIINVSVKTAPEVSVSKVTVDVEVKDNQPSLPVAENAEYYEKNLMDAIARAQGKEKSFEELRVEDIRNCLLSLPKDVAQGSVLMPRTADGTTFQGSDIHYLSSRMVSSPQWKGCPVFVSASVMQDYRLSANSNAACAYSSTIGEPVYNLMDTNMSPLLKEEVLATVQNDAKAVPAEVVSQILSFADGRKDLSIEQVQDVEKAWSAYRPLKMEDKVGKPLEDILYAARKKVEKRIDPKGLLRKYAFPENKIIELIDKGESEVKAKILVRPSTGIGEDKYRDVHLRLRIIGGLVRVCTPGRNVVGSSLQEALKNSPLDAAALSRIDRFILQTQQNKDNKNGIKPPH